MAKHGKGVPDPHNAPAGTYGRYYIPVSNLLMDDIYHSVLSAKCLRTAMTGISLIGKFC